MAERKDIGVFRLDNGFWGYRFSVIVDGRKISKKKSTDEEGNKLRTAKQASKARELAIAQARIDSKKKRIIVRKTFSEVYKE